MQGGQHLYRGQAARLEHAAQHRQGLPRLTLVDGVGQLVARDVARLAQIRREIVGGHPGTLAVGGAERAEEALDPAEILADVAGQHVGGPRLELHRRRAEMVVQPGLAVPRLARRDVDDLARRADRLDQWRGNRPAAAHQDQHRRREGVLHDLDQPRRVGRQQPPGLAHDDHPAVDQEGRGQAGVHDRPDAQLVAGAAADLLDDERMIAVADHVVEEHADLLRDQRGVVTLDEVHRLGPRSAHCASLTAASTSRARQVPLTSCTRTMRQPQAMPRAAAPMEASRRSVSSRSRILPRKVLLEAESRSG